MHFHSLAISAVLSVVAHQALATVCMDKKFGVPFSAIGSQGWDLYTNICGKLNSPLQLGRPIQSSDTVCKIPSVTCEGMGINEKFYFDFEGKKHVCNKAMAIGPQEKCPLDLSHYVYIEWCCTEA